MRPRECRTCWSDPTQCPPTDPPDCPQDLVCRRIEAAARHARENASLNLLRELEEEEAAGGAAKGAGATGSAKKKRNKAAEKQRDRRDKEELERLVGVGGEEHPAAGGLAELSCCEGNRLVIQSSKPVSVRPSLLPSVTPTTLPARRHPNRQAKLAEDEMRKQAEEEEKQRLVLARQAREVWTQ